MIRRTPPDTVHGSRQRFTSGRCTVAAILLFGLLAAPLRAVDVTEPVSERFAGADGDEVPDFQRHVVPLLGRLGCNGRSCHGSFQGRGGFRLSLFGYDFDMDHAALTGKASSEEGDRVSQASPETSLILLKPSLQKDHEGGRRFEIGSWEHHLFQRWIESGAGGAGELQELDRLEITPAEVVFGHDPAPIQLRVLATWRDGRCEEVTDLCRFRTNDEAVVTVDRSGEIRSTGRGDTHVIAFYDNGVAAVPIMRSFSDASLAEEVTHQPTAGIDRYIDEKLRKLGVRPSPTCPDAEFLRRVCIDLTGTLPSPSEVEQFLADGAADKRKRKIEELLDRPAYAAWWSNKLCDFTGCNPNQQAELGQETAVQWYMWIYRGIRRNVPYDQLVERIVLARGRRKGQSYEDYAEETSAYFRDNTHTEFSLRDTMPHYWTRTSLQKPEDKALAFAHSFLGIRLQCAQCHKHPFAPWTQRDFQQFSSFFGDIHYGVPPAIETRYQELAKQVGLKLRGKNGSPIRREMLKRAEAGHTIPWRELYVAERSASKTLRLLRSREVTLVAEDDPRQPIMEWMKEPGNPWFARAFVNRVWASYFAEGIVHPPDDLNPANPPSHPKLLDWLTAGFVESGFDMKWLHRQVVSSRAYQRSWQPNDTNLHARRSFSRAIPRRIPAEVIYDALKQALAGSSELEQVRTDLTRRAIGHLSMRLAGTYAMHVFGKPERAVNCDCERVNQPTLLQSVFLQNDPLVEQRLEESGWVREISERQQSGEVFELSTVVRSAWLRTLSRPPTAGEMQKGKRYLADATSLTDGLGDLLWALINTKEFLLN